MGLYGKDSQEDLPAPDGSEDASVSSWVNLHGNKYRDFSGSRRESCVPLRHRAAQQVARDHEMNTNAETKAVMQREERGSAEAHDSAHGEALHYMGSERRRGVLQASRPESESSISTNAQRRAQDNRANVTGGVRQIYRESKHDDLASVPSVQEPSAAGPVSPFSGAFAGAASTRGVREGDHFLEDHSTMPPLDSRPSPSVTETVGPAWLYATSEPQASSKSPLTPQAAAPQPSVADTLQQSRERVAARWFALKGAFEHPDEPLPIRQKETRTPVLAVFSLAGGVGKTSLVATVGRALSSMGEKVLLTDTTSHGLLPFYFGANELRHGTVRTFSPPSGSVDAPIYLVSHDMEQKGRDEETREHFIDEIIGNSQGTHRILLDLTTASSWVISQMSRMNPTVLIPVAPDMNSVISLQFVEKFFHGISDSEGRPLQPYYLLNQFDTSLPLHLDVREVLRRQLGDRLLPFVIHRAHSVSEALAEGMTVMDYAPREPIAEDYAHVATWLRSIAAPTMAGFRSIRWTESEE
jgi:cellulose synthase operon protein YhjQ